MNKKEYNSPSIEQIRLVHHMLLRNFSIEGSADEWEFPTEETIEADVN